MSAENLACPDCLSRSWLLARLAGHLDRHRDRIAELLALDPAELLAAVGGLRRAEIVAELGSFDRAAAGQRALTAGLSCLCRCHPLYPRALRELVAPPSVLYSTAPASQLGELLSPPGVAVVGSREPSPYGAQTAAALARGLAAAGLPVISGLARGIDSAAHAGALEAQGSTLAVLAGAADIPYPASSRSLHRRISRRGAVVSELPPGTRSRRWMFPARNRLIAALSAMTVVVEARVGSGALLTAGGARALGRAVGAVPGRVGSPLTGGPHELLREGATLVAGTVDILDCLAGLGLGLPPRGGERDSTLEQAAAQLKPAERAVLSALAEGQPVDVALARAGVAAEQGLALLSSLELTGILRRGPGGAYRLRS